MHIAMLSGEYPPRWGGMGSVVFHLSGHLARLGHRVTVLTRSHSQDAPSQEGVSVIEVPWFPLPMQFTRSYGRAALRALQHLHADDPVDVIHTHLPLISLNRREHARLRAMAPVVASLHGSWLGERDGMRLAARHREAATWRNPNDLAILISASWYARFERIALLDSDRSVANSLATEADFRARYRPLRDGVPRPYSGGWIMRCSDHSSCRWKMIGPRIMPFVDDMELAMTRGSNATLEPPRPCCLL